MRVVGAVRNFAEKTRYSNSLHTKVSCSAIVHDNISESSLARPLMLLDQKVSYSISMDFQNGKQLWLALGKMRAEKIAWRKSKEMKVKLVTVCPGLLIDSSSPHDHKETSFPYLKGKNNI
jgi:hypothetical protein